VRTGPTAGLLLALLAPLCAEATTVLAQSFEELTRHADAVVRGTVGPQEAHWDAAHRRIYTYVEVRVVDRLKGAPTDIVLVRSPGGVAEGVGQRVEGSPAFEAGEQVILFLERAPDEPGVMQVSALAAGKIHLATSKLGELRASRDLRGISQYRLGSLDRKPRWRSSLWRTWGPLPTSWRGSGERSGRGRLDEGDRRAVPFVERRRVGHPVW
jgi:hypothetical protein